MKYNLNLTQDYVSHWGLKEAVRELIANNIDEGGTLRHTILDFGPNGTREVNSELKLSTNKELPIEAFLMGYSVKSSSDAIGHYGEGLKLAMLILTRLDMHVLFVSGNYQYRFFFDIPEGFGVSTLHLEREELTEDERLSPNESVTNIIVYDVPMEIIDEVYTDSKPDSVLVDQRGLYCQGLLVEPDFYVSVNEVYYGINLDVPIHGNRDRTYFSDKVKIVPILERFFQPKDFLSFDSSWWVTHILERFSDSFKQGIAKAWLTLNVPNYTEEAIGNRIVLVPYLDSRRYKKQDGYIIAPYHSYGNYFMSFAHQNTLRLLEIKDEDLVENVVDQQYFMKLTDKIIADCVLCHTKEDVVMTLINYIPGLKSNRDYVKNAVLGLYEDKVTPRKRRVTK